MINQLILQFAKGGFVLTTLNSDTNEPVAQEVFVSQGKLIKAIRTAIDELSLMPKKAEGEAAE